MYLQLLNDGTVYSCFHRSVTLKFARLASPSSSSLWTTSAATCLSLSTPSPSRPATERPSTSSGPGPSPSADSSSSSRRSRSFWRHVGSRRRHSDWWRRRRRRPTFHRRCRCNWCILPWTKSQFRDGPKKATVASEPFTKTCSCALLADGSALPIAGLKCHPVAKTSYFFALAWLGKECLCLHRVVL